MYSHRTRFTIEFREIILISC